MKVIFNDMKNVLLVALTFVCTISFAQIQFKENNFEQFQTNARINKQYYFVDFYTDWCGYCRQLDKTTFKDTTVTNYVKKYYGAFKVNAEGPNGYLVARQHRVISYPTIIFYNAEGEELYRHTGYLSPQQFLNLLTEIKQDNTIKEVADRNNVLGNESINGWLTNYSHDAKERVFAEYICYQKAFDFGKEKNQFEFDLLLDGIRADVCPHPELYYQEGKGDESKVVALLDEYTKKQVLKPYELAYFLSEELKKGVSNDRVIRWSNLLFYMEKNYYHALLRSYAQLLAGDKSDAKSSLKEAKKLREKKDVNALEKELNKVL